MLIKPYTEDIFLSSTPPESQPILSRTDTSTEQLALMRMVNADRRRT